MAAGIPLSGGNSVRGLVFNDPEAWLLEASMPSCWENAVFSSSGRFPPQLRAHSFSSCLLCIAACDLHGPLVEMDFAACSPSRAPVNLHADPFCAAVVRNCSLWNPERGNAEALSYGTLQQGPCDRPPSVRVLLGTPGWLRIA